MLSLQGRLTGPSWLAVLAGTHMGTALRGHMQTSMGQKYVWCAGMLSDLHDWTLGQQLCIHDLSPFLTALSAVLGTDCPPAVHTLKHDPGYGIALPAPALSQA